MTPDDIKQQIARLQRVAKKTPLVISAVSGEGVPAALRALFKVIDEARRRADEPERRGCGVASLIAAKDKPRRS